MSKIDDPEDFETPRAKPYRIRTIELPDGEPIAFCDLAHLIADAMWPDGGEGDDRMNYGVARVNLDEELKAAATQGRLAVRNPSTLARQGFTAGAALDRAVLLPREDLQPYLSARGGLVLCLLPREPGEHVEPVSPADVQGQSKPTWTLTEPERYQGYARPLYVLLKAAHNAGRAPPKARDVLEAFREKQPPEIAQVNHDGFIYLHSDGSTKEASLDAISAAIRRRMK